MSDPLKPVNEGDSPGRLLNASTFNMVLDAARFHRDHFSRGGQFQFFTRQAEALSGRLEWNIRAHTDLDAHSIVALETVIIDPAVAPFHALNTPCFDSAAPHFEGATGWKPFGITTAPIAQGKIGPVAVVGAAVAKVAFSEAGHRYAVPIEGNTDKLASADSGPITILQEIGETHVPGEHTVLVMLGAGSSTYNEGGGGGGNPSEGEGGGGDVDPCDIITARNFPIPTPTNSRKEVLLYENGCTAIDSPASVGYQNTGTTGETHGSDLTIVYPDIINGPQFSSSLVAQESQGSLFYPTDGQWVAGMMATIRGTTSPGGGFLPGHNPNIQFVITGYKVHDADAGEEQHPDSSEYATARIDVDFGNDPNDNMHVFFNHPLSPAAAAYGGPSFPAPFGPVISFGGEGGILVCERIMAAEGAYTDEAREVAAGFAIKKSIGGVVRGVSGTFYAYDGPDPEEAELVEVEVLLGIVVKIGDVDGNPPPTTTTTTTTSGPTTTTTTTTTTTSTTGEPTTTTTTPEPTTTTTTTTPGPTTTTTTTAAPTTTTTTTTTLAPTTTTTTTTTTAAPGSSCFTPTLLVPGITYGPFTVTSPDEHWWKTEITGCLYVTKQSGEGGVTIYSDCMSGPIGGIETGHFAVEAHRWIQVTGSSSFTYFIACQTAACLEPGESPGTAHGVSLNSAVSYPSTGGSLWYAVNVAINTNIKITYSHSGPGSGTCTGYVDAHLGGGSVGSTSGGCFDFAVTAGQVVFVNIFTSADTGSDLFTIATGSC